jgi:hypothetical protein
MGWGRIRREADRCWDMALTQAPGLAPPCITVTFLREALLPSSPQFPHMPTYCSELVEEIG